MLLPAEQGPVSFDAPDELWGWCLALFYEGLFDGAWGVLAVKTRWDVLLE